jgi:hypothetical protein
MEQSVAPQARASVDAMPADAATLASLSPQERTAIYVNSIRKMMIFFTVLGVLALGVGVVFGIVAIQHLTN